MPRLAPQTILADRYRVDVALGAGGMGAVYRAHDTLLGDDVALKVLLTDEPDAMVRMREEVRLARKVTHRNVARTFDIGRHEDRPFVTMELIDGTSLAELLRQRSGAEADLVDLLAQLAEGLTAAHGASVVHRDLKPSNVLVTEAARAVLIDFGVAMAVGEDSAGVSGTWDYMSPEQLCGEAASAASDVFALGCLAFRALAGALPYAGTTPRDRGIARVDSRPDLDALAGVPPELSDLVAHCLARRPEDRPTAAQVAADLRGWLATAPAPGAASEVAPGAEPDGSTELLGIVGAADEEPTRQAGRGDRLLGVAPLVPRGGERASSLARGVSSHLAERLGRARGLRVASTSLLEGAGDPSARDLGRTAGLDLLVEGSLEIGAGAVARVEIRLVDLHTDATLLTRSVASPLSSLLDLSSDLAARVAEALRVELEVVTSSGAVSVRAVELYLHARHVLRAPESTTSEVVSLFDQCLELAPDFVPARVSRALAMARAYSFANQRPEAEDELEAAVLTAEELAPDAPDACAARGALELQRGHLRVAIRAFHRALQLAPTHPFALEQLGRVACESGRTREGIEHLELAASLDPQARASLCLVARSFALRGRLEEYHAVMRRISATRPHPMEATRLELRVADWYGRPDVAREILGEWPVDSPKVASGQIILALAHVVAGRAEGFAMMEDLERRVLASPLSPRFRAVVLQSGAEARARRQPERALEKIEQAVALPFFDLEWMELCPVLDGLRDHPRFIAAQRTLRARVSAVWGDDV